MTSLTPQVLQVSVLIQIIPVIETLPLLKKLVTKLRPQGQITKKSRLGCKAICGDDPFYDEYYSCEPINKEQKQEKLQKKETPKISTKRKNIKVTKVTPTTTTKQTTNETKMIKKLAEQSKEIEVKESSLPNDGTMSTHIQWLDGAPTKEKLPDDFKFCNNLSQCKFYTTSEPEITESRSYNQ